MTTEVPSGRQWFFNECAVQSAILFRVGIYGTAITLYFIITLICTQCLSDPERGFAESLMKCLEDVVYWLPGFVFLAPVVAHDLCKTINQVILPVNRLQREMALLMEDQSERPIALSDDEQWQELTESYNQLRGELLTLRRQISENALLSVEPLPPSLLVDEEPSLEAESLPLDVPRVSLDTASVVAESPLAASV